ncbi:hypothetical protein KM043_006131 [Ampulex compressa]|nr:hypothetical protein KM043_006131 [Ampulex compressa]
MRCRRIVSTWMMAPPAPTWYVKPAEVASPLQREFQESRIKRFTSPVRNLLRPYVARLYGNTERTFSTTLPRVTSSFAKLCPRVSGRRARSFSLFSYLPPSRENAGRGRSAAITSENPSVLAVRRWQDRFLLESLGRSGHRRGRRRNRSSTFLVAGNSLGSPKSPGSSGSASGVAVAVARAGSEKRAKERASDGRSSSRRPKPLELCSVSVEKSPGGDSLAGRLAASPRLLSPREVACERAKVPRPAACLSLRPIAIGPATWPYPFKNTLFRAIRSLDGFAPNVLEDRASDLWTEGVLCRGAALKNVRADNLPPSLELDIPRTRTSADLRPAEESTSFATPYPIPRLDPLSYREEGPRRELGWRQGRRRERIGAVDNRLTEAAEQPTFSLPSIRAVTYAGLPASARDAHFSAVVKTDHQRPRFPR